MAAKSGKDDAIYPWGNSDPTPEKANYSENIGFTSEVGRYPPNPYGLYDMAGNVRQWCMDWYHPDIPYLQNRTVKLPKEMQISKVIKGVAGISLLVISNVIKG